MDLCFKSSVSYQTLRHKIVTVRFSLCIITYIGVNVYIVPECRLRTEFVAGWQVLETCTSSACMIRYVRRIFAKKKDTSEEIVCGFRFCFPGCWCAIGS
jgi:hypothetical protein